MLQVLKAHNFKTFLNAEFKFSQRHLVIGKNNSGKTNLMTLMRFLGSTATFELDVAASNIPGGIDEICNWNLKKNDQIDLNVECVLEHAGLPITYAYDLRLERLTSIGPPGGQGGLRVVNERLAVQSASPVQVLLEIDGNEASLLNEEQPAGQDRSWHQQRMHSPKNATMLSKIYELPTNQRALLFRTFLRNWRYYSISPLLIRFGSTGNPLSSAASQLGASHIRWWTACDPQGESLSQCIFQLKNYDDRRYRRLLEITRVVEPALEAINYITAPGQQAVPFVTLSNQSRASWDGLSDGTLRALGLALIIETSAACSPPTNSVPSLTLIEEPENGIFPGLLRRFFDSYEEWAPTSQFIFTSHSPYFIDMFDDKRQSVTILKKAADRSQSIQPPDIEPSKNGDERLTLAMEYSSELFE
ncbi:MAG: AAA family ATPase [Gemmataceae bacterium]|nr:AAA family ATPase [Gemmataceae bacterium]MCI0743519.1 AAA family ATPase [Gemmataceae bacterium]